jgi:hypothetical protein
MNTHHFWAFDAGSLTMPVFNPLFGFSAITAPEISLEIEDVKDGTFMFPRGIVKGANASNVTFSRGAAPWDSDFYDWIMHAAFGTREIISEGSRNPNAVAALNRAQQGFIAGETDYRRDIVIVHFTRIDPLYTISRATGGNPISFGDPDNLADLGGLGPVEVLSKIPGRAWMLHSCIPVRYKSGTDMNASNGAISIMELEVRTEFVEEFSLGVGSPASIF